MHAVFFCIKYIKSIVQVTSLLILTHTHTLVILMRQLINMILSLPPYLEPNLNPKNVLIFSTVVDGEIHSMTLRPINQFNLLLAAPSAVNNQSIIITDASIS